MENRFYACFYRGVFRTDHSNEHLGENDRSGSDAGCGGISGGSAVDGERYDSELWQLSGEHGDNSVVDADVNGNVAGDG